MTKVYLIDWEDSASDSGWRHEEQLGNAGIALNQSIGYLIKENKKFITLAQSKCVSKGFAPYADLISIPKTNIKKKKQIKI